MNRVSHHQGAMVTHEEDVLVPQNLPQPLPLIYHIWRLVSCVPGTPVFEPEMLSIDLQTDNFVLCLLFTPAAILVDHQQTWILETPQSCGIWGMSVEDDLGIRSGPPDPQMDAGS